MQDTTPQLPLFTTAPHDPTKEIPYGYCHCGCGELTVISNKTDRAFGWVKGQPKRYIHGHTHRDGRPKEERFWSKVDKRGPDDCWEWQGCIDTTRYGVFIHHSKTSAKASAHRFSYQLHYGSIPDGLSVLHTCDNPPCVNPNHLFTGTHKDNTTDMIKKGRSFWQRNNHPITFKGETRFLTEWADLLGVKSKTLHFRLSKGWSIERALTQPVRGK